MDNNNTMNQQVPENSNPAANDHINRFVILQFGDGPQQDVIIDYRDNIRNAIEEQRQRQMFSSRSPIGMSSFDASSNTTQPVAESAETTSPAPRQEGIRGLHYPAFDVSNEGFYAANRDSSRLFDFLVPDHNNDSGMSTAAAGNSAANTTNSAVTPVNTGATVSPTSEPVAATTTNTTAPPAAPLTTTTTTTNNGGSNRNIILTVNYEYSSGVDQEEARDRSASLVLNVPNVPQSEDETRLQALIRFATIIAFRTIAMSLQNKTRGITEEQFGKLPVKNLEDFTEKTCPICYEDFDEPTNKRKRSDEDENEEEIEQAAKTQKASSEEKRPTSDTQKQEKVKVQYSHIPIEMPCKHVFGQDCLHEWLKQNNSCPLCRYKLYNENRNSDGIQTTTMNLPNLARFLNDNSRDSLLNGEINRLPMLLVSNDSDPAVAAESLDNDLRNNLNNVPIIVTAAPTTATTIGTETAMSPLIAGAGSGWNRFTRENIVRRLINSLTNSVGGTYAASSSVLGRSSLAAGVAASAGLAFPAFRAQATERRERAMRRAENSLPNEFGNRGNALFPMGVSSRRTANGVETVNISGGGEQPNPDDYMIQESIVNDLLYRNSSARHQNSPPPSETMAAEAAVTQGRPANENEAQSDNNDTSRNNNNNNDTT